MISRYGNHELKNTEYAKSESDSDDDEATTDISSTPNITARYLENINFPEQTSTESTFQFKKRSSGGNSFESSNSHYTKKTFTTFKQVNVQSNPRSAPVMSIKT